MPVHQCPMHDGDEVTTCVLLGCARMLVYKNRVYTINLDDECNLNELINEGFSLIVVMSPNTRTIVIKDEILHEHHFNLYFHRYRHYVLIYVGYKWVLERAPRATLYYSDPRWQVLKIQRWWRRLTESRLVARRLVLATALHYGENHISTLPLELVQLLIGKVDDGRRPM